MLGMSQSKARVMETKNAEEPQLRAMTPANIASKKARSPQVVPPVGSAAHLRRH